jgi:hypothetical protein
MKPMQDKIDRVLEKLSEQAVQLARIEERLKQVEGLKEEVDNLKRWRWTMVGGITVLSFGAQYILKHMVK